MTLYIRFLLILLKVWFSQKQAPLAASRLRFRVLPFDCDFNGHLNNARYFSFMDLGRLYFLGQLGLFKTIYRKRWMPVIVATNMSFIRSIKPLQSVNLTTRILAWQGAYIYLEQRFEQQDELVAIALVKGCFVAAGKKIAMADVMGALGDPELISPPMPEMIRQWQQLTEVKKVDTITPVI